ncbi:MAG: hypothetical protein J0L57_15785 [Burkholderiales bacterium]|nr:hypothetical protein [Burkholderiales bacterium]
MARIVGSRDRSEFSADPVEAWKRGRRLDDMLAAASPKGPKGVTRAPHRTFNARDDERRQAMARRLNRPAGATR